MYRVILHRMGHVSGTSVDISNKTFITIFHNSVAFSPGCLATKKVIRVIIANTCELSEDGPQLSNIRGESDVRIKHDDFREVGG